MANFPSNPPPPPGYPSQNPYSYDPNYDYVPWLPGRQGPNVRWIIAIVAVALFCGCCGLLMGTILGIELPGILQPSAPPAVPPELEPTPEGLRQLLMLVAGLFALG